MSNLNVCKDIFTIRENGVCEDQCGNGYLCQTCVNLVHKYITLRCGAESSQIIGSYLVCNHPQNVEQVGKRSRPFSLVDFKDIVVNNLLAQFRWTGVICNYPLANSSYSAWARARAFDDYRQNGSTGVIARRAIQFEPKSFIVERLSTQTKEVIVGSRSAIDSYNNKQVVMVFLKAALFNKILLGQTVEASFNHTIVYNDVVRVLSLFSWLIEVITCVYAIVAGAVISAVDLIGDERLTTYSILAAVLFFIGFWIHSVRRFYRWLFPEKVYVLAETTVKGGDRFVSKEITGDGTMYKFIYNGKLIMVPHGDGDAVTRQEEMALPGSNFFPSNKKSVGAILVATELTELTPVGCFFRYNNYLVTAEHVVSQVASGVADVYLAPHVEGQRGIRRLDLSNVLKLDDELSLENNVIKCDYDLFAVKLTDKQWSRIGINEVSVKLESRYNQVVSAVGFINGVLMTSAGRTVKDSGYVELFHTASTNPGFSGSPLYSGSSVIGMHIAADCNKNVAIRIELIRHFLKRKNESNSTIGDEYREYDRRDGRDYKKFREGDYEVFYEESSGRVRYQDWLEEQEEEELLDASTTKQKAILEKRRQRRKAAQSHRYQNESAPVKGVIRLPSEKPVHCNVSPKPQTEANDYINNHMGELEKLGYDKTKYIWPDINQKTEQISCRKHIELFNERAVGRKPMTDKEKDRIVRLVTEKMSANKYEAPVGYKTNANIKRIINSSLVDIKKSPGHPYQEQGLMTNGCVLKKYGDSFVDVVLDNWNNDFQLKVFLKAEPTKGAKIEKGMPRIITGMPLHKMVKNQAVFENFRASMVENWQQSPVKYAFSPLVPGHIRHLASRFKNQVYSSDKSNWDFNCFAEFFSVVAEVIVELSYQPEDMSDDEYEEYCTDVRQCCAEVCNKVKYRCTNGEVLQSVVDGIMKSGWLLTIDANSICQIAFDYWVKIRMGMTNDEILADEIVAGGDDVIQEFPSGFDTAKYREIAKEAGFELSEFEVTETFEGCEFFSNTFSKRDGVWTFRPQRFTKHVEKLRMTKLEDLPMALSSHMMNHAWDNGKYKFFADMYRSFRKTKPDLFNLQLLRKQRELQNKLSGCE